MNAYRAAAERPIRIRSRMKRRAVSAVAWLGVLLSLSGVLIAGYSLSMELSQVVAHLTAFACVLAFADGVISGACRHSLKTGVAIAMISVAIVELAMTMWLDITGVAFLTLAALCVPAALFGALLGNGLVAVWRWLAEPGPSRPPSLPEAAPALAIEPESPADRMFVRQLASSTTLLAIVVPLAVAAYLLASIRRDASVESTAAIVGATASLAFVESELLQLRDVSARTSAIVMGVSIVAATALCLVVDRRLFDGSLGLGSAYGTMLPGAMMFAAIAGWFAATGVRAIGEGSPVFHAIAREEQFVDDEEPVSDEVLPSSTRRLLQRVRTRRQK